MNQVQTDIAAAIRNVWGDVPVYGNATGTGVRFGSNDSSMTASENRPGTRKIKEFQSDSSKGDAFLAEAKQDTEETRIIRCNLIKHKGDILVDTSKYQEAYSKYREAMEVILGKGFQIPLTDGLKSEVYMKLTHWERIDLMACCNAMAECLFQQKLREEALDWIEEVNILYKNAIYTIGQPIFDWLDFNVEVSEHFVQRITALARASDIFFELGNTSAAVHRRWLGQTTMSCLPPHVNEVALRGIVKQQKVDELTQLRHPDPQLAPTLSVQDEKLQVHGSWQKVSLKQTGVMATRTGSASFVWNGHLYIAGGEKSVDGHTYRDIWSLDLEKLDMWNPLPSYPILSPLPLKVDFFDLISRKWGFIKTTYSSQYDWPYVGPVSEYAMQIVDGRLYVFGGTHDRTQLGCNLFLVLDIATKTWRRMSGSAIPVADNSCPGPRRYPTSWANKAGSKIYIMYGEANRQIMQEKHGAMSGYGYDDIWSWSIPEGKWKKEKFSSLSRWCLGSQPEFRQNETLDTVVVFGGYSPTLPTFYAATNDSFSYTYYADTFILDPSTLRWKQVLTRGFPTYRAQAQLVSDPTTGKTFLFGGYTNTEFVPSCHYISRSFSDLWQLKMDVKGGYFEGVDLEEEARTAEAGPWQRCFNCGCAGPWKKCGGEESLTSTRFWRILTARIHYSLRRMQRSRVLL
ncbi:hypothetical protein K439DRAFT_1618627 [Ramaria rubella]|nr:hypothetical protein K439DRAFT_1618627 [Ramaria rubella]